MTSATVLTALLRPGERASLAVRSGSGMVLTLEDGRTVLDAGSLSSCLLGHCHPAIVDAITGAARTVYVNDATGYAPREQAGVDLLRVAFADEPWAAAVVFTVSSSEAADLALMLAQMLSGRDALVCRELGYHGGLGLGREVSLHPFWSAGLIAEGHITLPHSPTEVRRLPVPECGRTFPFEDSHECTADCLRGAPAMLRDAAAVMMDYSQGGIVASPGYQDALAGMASAAGALWIADETVTGFGRIGRMFAFQRGSSRPDIVTLGKGITGGGAPGGALVLSRRVVEAIGSRRWMTSSTFRGHPISVAAVSAVMRTLEADDLVAQAAPQSRLIARRLAEIVERHDLALRFWGEGMLWFIELDVAPEHGEAAWLGDGAAEPLPSVVQRRALDHGALVGAFSGNLLWLHSPARRDHEPDRGTVCDALESAIAQAGGREYQNAPPRVPAIEQGGGQRAQAERFR